MNRRADPGGRPATGGGADMDAIYTGERPAGARFTRL
jgi:hypothetical protein